eukprot:comp21932_c2_seq1/m.31569 comp21932_c2_seq1/g.31569  ORF comp21932_c2_seq1/g.31569 comp21932_c2_seq1/m.31569 type:complete len:269 (-) comp21932_c2_seq1:441-1247(-)
MEELRSTWQFPYVSCFCQVYQGLFSLPSMTADELERHLAYSSTEAAVNFINNLLGALLKGLTRTKNLDVHAELGKQLQKWDPEGAVTERLQGVSFSDLTPLERLTALRQLCDARLHFADDIGETLKGVPGEDQRIEHFGEDSKGNKYWYFGDTRLYKEEAGEEEEEEEGEEEEDMDGFVVDDHEVLVIGSDSEGEEGESGEEQERDEDSEAEEDRSSGSGSDEEGSIKGKRRKNGEGEGEGRHVKRRKKETEKEKEGSSEESDSEDSE